MSLYEGGMLTADEKKKIKRLLRNFSIANHQHKRVKNIVNIIVVLLFDIFH